MKRQLRVPCLTLIFLLIIPAATLAADPVFETGAVLGLWSTEPNEDGGYSHVEIYEEDGRYIGRIVWINKPLYGDDEPEGPPGQPRLDKENPDVSLQGRPLLGMELMYGMKFNGKNKWEDGRIYDPESGKEYRCKVTLKDSGTMEMFGYIKVGFAKLGRDTIWKRVTTPNAGSE